jgi:SET domain-containing protein
LIIEYDGELVTDDQLTQRYGEWTAPYALAYRIGKHDKHEDAACSRGLGAIVNHSSDPAKINAMYEVIKNRSVLTCVKDIANDEELFIDYGNEYRFDEPTTYKTHASR